MNVALRRPQLLVPAWFLALPILVVLPLARRGWLLLLDRPRGPVEQGVDAYVGKSGFAISPLFDLAQVGLSRMLGPATASWVPIALALGVAAFAASTLVPPRLAPRLAAGTLYAINPVVFERLWAGQIGYLWAYALLPLALREWLFRERVRLPHAVLWFVLLAAIDLHFVWIGGVPVAASLLLRPAAWRRGLGSAASRAGAVAGGLAAMSFVAIPFVGGRADVSPGSVGLESFRTFGRGWRLYTDLLGLYGFWRREARLPREAFFGWPFFLAAILLLSVVGGVLLARTLDRRVAVGMGAVAVVGFLLALGDRGPLGPGYEALFLHLPGFGLMREPQKFVALLAVTAATLFGWGIGALGSSGERPQVGAALVAVALPLLYSPTLLWGAGGRLEPSRFPAGWIQAERIMGSGDGRALALPLHLYQSYPFTDGRSVGDLPERFFSRRITSGELSEVVGGDELGSTTEGAYLRFLVGAGPENRAFGSLVAGLGFEYVLLLEGGDHGTYGWLDRQPDLEPVLREDGATLYRVAGATPEGRTARESARLRHWGEALAIANDRGRALPMVTFDRDVPGPVELPDVAATIGVQGAAAIDALRISPTEYRLPGDIEDHVALPEPASAGWDADGAEAEVVNGGALGLSSSEPGSAVVFRPWATIRLLWVASGVGLVGLVVLAVRTRRRG